MIQFAYTAFLRERTKNMTYFLMVTTLFWWRSASADISHLTNKFNKLIGGGGSVATLVLAEPPPVFVYDEQFDQHHYYVPAADPNRPAPLPPQRPSPPTTTEFTLPEIIINRSAQLKDQQHYIPPPAYDEDISGTYLPPSPISSTYLPPDEHLSNHPQFDEIPVGDSADKNDGGYIISSPSQTYLPATTRQTVVGRKPKAEVNKSTAPLRLQLLEMKCLANTDSGYFKVSLAVQSFLVNVPVIDEDASASDCNIQLVQSRIVIDINGASFSRCAIRLCNETGQGQLCLKLRFPQIKGMSTLGDSLLTLKCLPQSTIVAKTHALQVAVSRDKYAHCKHLSS